MKRKIIRINEDKCNGCGECIPACPEGAIQIIDGKARLVSDLMCDGLGACIGQCPQGAITIEEREAQPYDERRVMEEIVRHGPNTIRAHLNHLREHRQHEYLQQALAFLQEHSISAPCEESEEHMEPHQHHGCPGAAARTISRHQSETHVADGTRQSELRQWPIQMHLLSPHSPAFRGADVVLAADCVAYALGDFHKDWLRGKALGIACPKLDSAQSAYVEKIRALIDDAKINTLTVMIMEVPCCGGLLQMAKAAAAQASRKVPIKWVMVSIEGRIIKEEWV